MRDTIKVSGKVGSEMVPARLKFANPTPPILRRCGDLIEIATCLEYDVKSGQPMRSFQSSMDVIKSELIAQGWEKDIKIMF
jgi:hypothetical protein